MSKKELSYEKIKEIFGEEIKEEKK